MEDSNSVFVFVDCLWQAITLQVVFGSGLRIQRQGSYQSFKWQFHSMGCNRLLLRRLADVSHSYCQTEHSQCAYYSLQNDGIKIRLGRIGVAHE